MLNYLPLALLTIFCLIATFFGKRLDKSAEYRKKRRPFSDEMRLLRRPGEGVFKQIEKIDDKLAIRFFAIPYFGAVSVILIGVLLSLVHISILGQSVVFAAVAIVYSIFIVISFGKMVALVEDRRKNYLGYFGECAVAEFLDNLKQDGYYVFHDVPCRDGGKNTNIDHVVVGPTGLFAVETKTYSKLSPIEEKRRERIEFVGKQINFSWGSDTKKIHRAVGQAVWLSGQFDRRFFVQAILTFPGWTVVEREIGTAWVLSLEGLVVAIKKRSKRSLNQDDIDEIRDYLVKECRDVEY